MLTRKVIIKIPLFAIMIIALSLLSCVGTVSDKNAKDSKVQSTTSSNAAASFEGLQSINPISHDKVELFFLPASGDPANLTYEIYINNSPIPVKIGGRSLSTNASGLYYFAVTGLSLQTLYNFNMRVIEAGSETQALQLDPSKSMSAMTYANETADFMGASSLQLGAGETGKNTVTAKWVPATITGTNLNPKPRDPVAYEIIYISQLGGIANLNNPNYHGTDRVVIQTPSSIGSPPALDKDREYTITGLNADTTYYVQVRAIHKAYYDYVSVDPLYKRELNTHFLKIKTLASGALFDFNSSLVYLTNPDGENGLTNLDVSWIPASGEFNHYRVCYKQVATALGPEPVVDYLQDADLDLILNNTAACLQKPSSTTNVRLGGLTSYAYYQVKVLACKNIACDSTNRIKSDLTQKRIITNIAPFTGILSIQNPSDDTKLKEITINFDAPVISTGYLNRFKLYCYNSVTDTNPAELALDGSTSAATGKTNCDGIKSMTTMPATLADYASLDNIVLELPVINGSARYCFSLLPSIYSIYLNQENKQNAIIKCFTPEIKTPNILQFPGRDNLCSVSDKSISITWPTPTGGLYSKYMVLYREKTLPSDLFNFPKATSDYLANKTNNSLLSVYKSIDNLDKTTLTYTINSLVPGRSYSIGVLTYLEDGSNKVFSQFNLNIGDCTLPLPSPTFNEWVDIFAIGPKEDGLTPPKSDGVTPAANLGARNYILETLDDDAIPVEIATLLNKIDPDTTNTMANARLGSLTFNGAYGARDAKDTNPVHQYSNSGIIRFGWKDVTFYAGTETLNSYITNPAVELTPAIKSSRKFGYKVYRSEDNQLTWVDMTKKSTLNKFQSTTNEGLVHPSSFSWRARNNATPVSENIIFFTDYSVKFSGIDGEIDRARTYWYKIVPVFDGKELAYSTTGNTSHNIIRVTLPPRNMALVHRMIANRTLCLEMNKTINKTSGNYYSCNYNGLGASGLQTPWTVSNTVYDLGGDLLVDRFELSCPFSRGDVNGVNSDSEYDQIKTVFKGASKYGNNFKGCYNETSALYEPNQGTNPTAANYLYGQVIPGDCFGRDAGVLASPIATACADPTKGDTQAYNYPGADGRDNKAFCTDPTFNGPNFSNMADPTSQISAMNFLFPTQSEYAAVYYMRSGYRHGNDSSGVPGKMPGGTGQTLTYNINTRQNSCSVNLGYTTSIGEYRPRWIPVNSLFGRLKNGASASITLYNKTIGQIRSNTDLYDGSSVKAPTSDLLNANRMTTNSTLIRVATSNSAKLPPLDGMSQTDLYNTCATYKVQVGVETTAKGFVALDSVQSKRLMRKKESIVAAAWPSQYDNTKVTNIENGLYTEGAINNSCNSFQKPSSNGTGSYSKTQLITPLFPQDSKTNPLFMEGSSSRDPASTTSNSEKCVSRFGIQDLAGNMRETNADEIFCDFVQDTLYLGNTPNDVKESIPTSGGMANYYDPNFVTPWVLSSTQSGSCSLNEAGASRTGSFISGGTFNSIYTYLGLDTTLIKKVKPFDQDAVLSGRNGDGSFLDFGQMNLGPSLSQYGAISMEDPNLLDTIVPAMLANYFNPVLGIPLTCGAGCDANGSDNADITSDKLVISKAYDTVVNPLSISLLDFPTNNAQISNTGVSEITSSGLYDSNDPDASPVNYIDSINTGASYATPADNYANMSTTNPPNANPGVLASVGFKVGRNNSMKMYTGGGAVSEAGRYSLSIEGTDIESERLVSYQNGGRCAIMINND